ncbi:MAG: hypothetical protein R2883_08270 [Caldisericia bacterium]
MPTSFPYRYSGDYIFIDTGPNRLAILDSETFDEIHSLEYKRSTYSTFQALDDMLYMTNKRADSPGAIAKVDPESGEIDSLILIDKKIKDFEVKSFDDCLYLVVTTKDGIFGYKQKPADVVTEPVLYEYSKEPFGFHPALIRDANIGYSEAENIGVCWTRPSLYAYQFIIQPDISKEIYDFRMHDRLYGETPDNISILGNILPDISGKGAREKDHPDYMKKGSYEPIDIAAYEKFVRATIERYDGDGINDMPGLTNPVKFWQVDNEPPRDGKDDFAVLQEITYKAIKEACPDCQVMIGGATGFPDAFDKNFKAYSKILDDLDGKYIDIFDFHWYGDAFGDYRELGTSLELIRKTLDETGFSDIPIWITEMGAYSGDPVDFGKLELPPQTEQMQAIDYFKRFIYPVSLGIEKVFPAFGLIEGFKQDDAYFDHTGLIYDGKLSDDLGKGVKKLGYWTYKYMTESLTGSDWDTLTEIYAKDGVYGYKIIKDGNPLWIFWWDWFEDSTLETKEVSVSLDNIFGTVELVEVVPNTQTGKELQDSDYPNFFATKQKEINEGQLNLELGMNPVIIEITDLKETIEIKYQIDKYSIRWMVWIIQSVSTPVVKDGRTTPPARFVTEPLGKEMLVGMVKKRRSSVFLVM